MRRSTDGDMNPLVKVAVALIIGMTLGRYGATAVPLWSWSAMAALCLAIVLFSGKRRLSGSWSLLLAVASIGGLLMADTEINLQRKFITEPFRYDAVLLTEPVQHGKVMKTDLAISTTEGMIKVKASILRDTVYNNYKRLHVGDGITAYSQLEEPVNFRDSEFDYARWLRLHGFDAETFIYYRNWKKASVDLSFLNIVDRTLIELKRAKQQWMQTYMRAGLSGQTAAVAIAMTLGDKQHISEEVKDDYSISGASHVLALSGLHLSIIYAIFLFGFNLCKGIPYISTLVRYHLSDLLVLLLIWLYALLVDFSPSVVRSATMITVYSMVGLLNRDKFSLNTLALTAIILLAARPQNLWDVGFQMSFMAMLALVAALGVGAGYGLGCCTDRYSSFGCILFRTIQLLFPAFQLCCHSVCHHCSLCCNTIAGMFFRSNSTVHCRKDVAYSSWFHEHCLTPHSPSARCKHRSVAPQCVAGVSLLCIPVLHVLFSYFYQQ